MKTRYHAIPVIMYHSIGIVNKDWFWGHLTCPWELFENHLRWLKRTGICTISLQELYEYKKKGISVPSRAIVLTFDDGYLDNWVFAYPLLKKYGFRGTIFVNPEFVDPRKIIRKNLENVWKKDIAIEELETLGFLSWDEIKIMETEGVIDIQSHTMSHTWYFCSDEIIDFHHPGNNKYPWIFWNACPDRKSYYLKENQEHFVPYGTPIYKNGRSLGIRRYYEDNALTNHLVEFVKIQGDNFFKIKDWKDKMFSQVNYYKSQNRLKGGYETDEEQKDRFRYELVECKKILETRLKKKINFLCWPGGANSDLSVKIGFEAGYLAYTCSADVGNGKNIFSEDPSIIYRIGAPNVQWKGMISYLGGVALIIWFFAFRGNMLSKMLKKVIKLFVISTIKLKIRKNVIPSMKN